MSLAAPALCMLASDNHTHGNVGVPMALQAPDSSDVSCTTSCAGQARPADATDDRRWANGRTMEGCGCIGWNGSRSSGGGGNDASGASAVCCSCAGCCALASCAAPAIDPLVNDACSRSTVPDDLSVSAGSGRMPDCSAPTASDAHAPSEVPGVPGHQESMRRCTFYQENENNWSQSQNTSVDMEDRIKMAKAPSFQALS